MIKDAILQLAKKEDISYDLAKESMNEIMGGKATDVQMSAYLTALSMKGETIDEITACRESSRDDILSRIIIIFSLGKYFELAAKNMSTFVTSILLLL